MKEGTNMKKSLEKHELKITIFMIVLYLVLNSICINNFGDTHFITAICNILLSLVIIIFILKKESFVKKLTTSRNLSIIL